MPAKSAEIISNYYNKVIDSVALVSDKLQFRFNDGTTLAIFDGGQSCCEIRYMSTDDDLKDYSGATLVGWDLGEFKSEDKDYDAHEIQFLNIRTSKGVLVCQTHNEHNGYYGGFWISAEGT